MLASADRVAGNATEERRGEMKKSEYISQRRDYWSEKNGGNESLWLKNCIEDDLRAVEALEKFQWDPEPVEWPDLRPTEMRLGGYGLIPVASSEGFTLEMAERIVQVWNTRRPRGPMEQQIREAISSLPENSAVALEIEAALEKLEL
jgi:hypothetical protein